MRNITNPQTYAVNKMQELSLVKAGGTYETTAL